MEQIERIKYMEQIFDEVCTAIKNIEQSYADFVAVQDKVKELEKYYSSSEWIEDFEADENGLIPHDLKRGILSEDGIYNILNDITRISDIIDLINTQTSEEI